MAEETASNPGLLSRRLFGALNWWSPAGDEVRQQESPESESARKESTESEPAQQHRESEYTRLESPESESPQHESREFKSARKETLESESAQQEPRESESARLESVNSWSARPESNQPSEPDSSQDEQPEPGKALAESKSDDSDNPLSIFGLPTPTGSQKDRQSGKETESGKEKGSKKGKGKKCRQGGSKRSPAEPRPPAKKPPMRTARDVISRIQWDRNLPEDCFDIGYLDRFLGVVEKPFASFTWGDLPWQECDVLAIPQHRIQYFKYRGVKVWDKASRLDAVFGSAGSSEDIEAAMTRIDEEVEEQRRRRAEEALLAGPVADADPLADSGDDAEQEVEVAFQAAAVAGPAGVPDKARSTHFLAARITSEAARAAAQRVQAAVVAHDPSLGACAMRPSLLHVTLCMVHLENAEAAAGAGRCLRQTIDDLRETLRADDRTLHIRGLKTFGARVLYAPVAPCSSFNAVAEALRTRLEDVPGVHLTNAFEYVPHMTLLKVSRPVARARRSRFIDAAGYAAHQHEELGEQRFDNVHLCAIGTYCALDGFYVAESSVTF